MFPSYLLALREGLEIALMIGIVLGALKKINQPGFSKAVWLGAGSAAVVSLISALGINAAGAAFEGKAEEIFEGLTMLLAAGVLTWMIFWMQRQAHLLKPALEEEVQQAAAHNSAWALYALAFFAVVREGIELALFLTAASMATSNQQTIIGALLGLGTAALLGYLLFASTMRLNLRRFFQVTSILLIFFAAGLVAHGVHELIEASWIPAGIEHVWDINHILDENSTLGSMLIALFGYNGNPALTEVFAYLAYLAFVFFGLRWRSKSLPMIQTAENSRGV